MYVVNSFEFRLFSAVIFVRCMIVSRIMLVTSVAGDLQIVMHEMITGEYILENVHVFVISVGKHLKQKPPCLCTANFIQMFFHIHVLSVINGSVGVSS
jgi:hypothetical protein